MTNLCALAGDWHGNMLWSQSRIMDAQRAGAKRIYHLGDFGVWPGDGGKRFLDKMDATCAYTKIDIWVTPGNHEDYPQIQAVPASDDGLQWIRPHIALIPRGHRWTDGGRTFVSLGGAPSIDFPLRIEHVSWWRDEMITLSEARAVAEAGHADIMLAHDSPDNGTQRVADICNTPPHVSGWSDSGLRYAREGRDLMNIAVRGVKPKLFAHGHYHVFDATERGATRYLALACDGMQGNVVLLDLDTLEMDLLRV